MDHDPIWILGDVDCTKVWMSCLQGHDDRADEDMHSIPCYAVEHTALVLLL